MAWILDYLLFFFFNAAPAPSDLTLTLGENNSKDDVEAGRGEMTRPGAQRRHVATRLLKSSMFHRVHPNPTVHRTNTASRLWFSPEERSAVITRLGRDKASQIE